MKKLNDHAEPTKVKSLDLSNNVCEYEVNWLTIMKRLLEENETLMQMPARVSPIYKPKKFLRKIWLKSRTKVLIHSLVIHYNYV